MPFSLDPPSWNDYFNALIHQRCFAEHGCIPCKSKEAPYGGCMLCVACLERQVERMQDVEKKMKESP